MVTRCCLDGVTAAGTRDYCQTQLSADAGLGKDCLGDLHRPGVSRPLRKHGCFCFCPHLRPEDCHLAQRDHGH